MITPYRPSREQAEVHRTPRERQIGELLGRGFSNKAIAAELFLAESTVKVYVSRLFRRLGLSEADPRMNTRVEAVLMLRGGLPCKLG